MVKSKVIPIIDQPNIAVIIPARGGSKEIPLKNLRDFCGKPLIAHSILAAKNAKTSLRIFVSTDHLEIARIARQYGAEVIDRPMAYASDTATSESALIHALKAMHKVHQYKPDVIIFLQPTSPLRRPWDLDAALSTYFESGVDSLFSVFRFSRLLWRHTSTKLTSFNYDYKKRPRRQDRDPEFVESGSIYIFKPDLLTKQSNRLGGTIGYYEQDHWSGFEIDTLDDWELAEWVYRRHFQNEGAQNVNLSQLRMVVFDFDGVFTDNKVLTLSDGTEAVLCDRSDGLKLKELKNHDLALYVISTETNDVVKRRCEKLKLTFFTGIDDKLSLLKKLLKDTGIDPQHVLYVGNDINDLECLKYVGIPFAPSDAQPEAKDVAHVLKAKGGYGAVREVCDIIINSIHQKRGQHGKSKN